LFCWLSDEAALQLLRRAATLVSIPRQSRGL
jgi:hypothetical protein